MSIFTAVPFTYGVPNLLSIWLCPEDWCAPARATELEVGTLD